MPSYDTATGAQALTLKLVGNSNAEIEAITGIQPRTLNTLHCIAIARGLNLQRARRSLITILKIASALAAIQSRLKRLLQRCFQRSIETNTHGRKPALRS
ncbi:hypothetical protein K469DRAFT_793594 [Zopfia rhizophila CBS 207.26]|uniref:HTH luxR-type domain-containing protein n=1 Tax=Zopfia rhizophila CBS 207.26 TaxID=1314779 RepID=A0A6A6DRW9_9PEZI|nr:hypothetical protein K469DRAFT_793594 [Zopfia rhizophila CBS 207.26]